MICHNILTTDRQGINLSFFAALDTAIFHEKGAFRPRFFRGRDAPVCFVKEEKSMKGSALI